MPQNRSRLLAWTARGLIFGVAAATAWAFFINWCAIIFDCGCQSYWNGASAQCNIHQEGVKHCPWCVKEAAAGVAFIGTLAAQLAIALWPGDLRWLRRLLLALIAFPLVSGVIGAVTGWWVGYWSP